MERDGHYAIPETISVPAPDRTIHQSELDGAPTRHERYRCAFSASDPANRCLGNLQQRPSHLYFVTSSAS